MSVKTVDYSYGLSVDTTRGPSRSIWGAPGAPNAFVADFLQEPYLGTYFWDDFLDTGGLLVASGAPGAFGRWATYAETNGAITDDAIQGGGWNLAASTTGNQGVALSTRAGAFQFVTAAGALQGRIAFEARVRISSIAASTLDFFVGLMDHLPVASAVPLSDTDGALSTTPGLIGFHARGGATNPGDFSVAYNVASGTVQYPTGLTNLVNTVTGTAYVAATYVKLGFLYDPNPYPVRISTAATTGQTAGNTARPCIRFFVNGVPAVAFLTSSDLTTGAANNALFSPIPLGPVVAFKQQSTTASISASIDWIRVAQVSLL
jgi:hypothetical protein